MPARALAVKDMFYSREGHCKNCGKPLKGKQRSWCGDECSGAMLRLSWSYVSAEVTLASTECLRCHRKDTLEIAHMLPVEAIASKYPNVMTKTEFIESKKMLVWDRLWRETGRLPTREKMEELFEWTEEIEEEWLRQIRYNREYMTAILDRRNLRVFCRACHDYSHAREKLQRELKRLAAYRPGSVRRMLVEARLKALDALNAPRLIREHGYRPYTLEKKARYQYWYKALKEERASQRADKT